MKKPRKPLSLYTALVFFKDVRIEAEQDVLIVTVQERPSITQIDFSGNKSFPSDKNEGRLENKSVLQKA